MYHPLYYFLICTIFQELSNIIKVETEEPDVLLPNRDNVLEADDSQNNEKKIVILKLLASLCEQIGPSCLKDTKQTLDFVQVYNFYLHRKCRFHYLIIRA